jgi:molecular chaperone GrpE
MSKKDAPIEDQQTEDREQQQDDQLQQTGDRAEELTADLQRLQAEFVNFRRRADQDRSAILDLAKQDAILQLLPVLDNIGRALTHIPDDLTDNAWAKGVGHIAKQADETLKSMGLTKIEALGEPFDPNLHEAIGGEGETVVEELQPGYKLGDKVIRHAMVRVGNDENEAKEGDK